MSSMRNITLPEENAERKDVDKDGCLQRQALILAIQRCQCRKRPIIKFEIECHHVHIKEHLFLDDFNIHVFVVDHFPHLKQRIPN